MTKQNENVYTEKRRVIHNEYDSQTPNKRVQNAAMILSPPPPPPSKANNNNPSPPSFEQQAARKLSSISEKTEKTETDDSEPDLLRIKLYNPKRQAIITPINKKKPPPPLPKKLPIIKNRKTIVRDDENENDSGVERSSSDKSFEEPNTTKQRSSTPTSLDTTIKSKISNDKSTVKTPPTLSFSNVFVTSVSKGDTTEQSQDDEIKKPLTTSPSSSSTFSDQFLLTDVTTPKPILKKSNQQSSPSSDQDRIPPSYNDQKKISSIINTRSYVKLNQSHLNNNSTKHYVPYKIKSNPLLHNIPKPAPRPSLKQSSFDKTR